MGYKTKIDWCDSSWNPVTGCQHDCEYCYARSLANRYGGFDHDEDKNPVGNQFVIGVQELDKPKHIMRKNGLHKAPYISQKYDDNLRMKGAPIVIEEYLLIAA